MPTYTKLSPADFRKKLKNGEYESLTGARRAIGKMQEWSESERDKARAAAAKHFGEEAPPTKPAKKKKAAKKAAAKPAPAAKKMPKKRAKKAAKKAVKKPVGPGPGRGRKKKAAKKTKEAAPKKAAPKSKASPKPSNVDVDARIESTRNAVQAYAEAVDVLKKCQTEQHSVEEGLKSAAAGVTQLINAMQTDIVHPLTDAERRGAELFSRAAPTAVVPGTSPPVVPGNGGPNSQYKPPATAAPTPPAVTPPPVVPPTT